MFEIPQAKRVRRSDLYSTSSRSTSPNSDGDNDKNGDVNGDTARKTASTKTKGKGKGIGNTDDQVTAQAALASFFSSRFEFAEEGHSEQHPRSKDDDDDKHSKQNPPPKVRQQAQDQTNRKPRDRDRDTNKGPKDSAVADRRRRRSNASSSSADFSADSRDSSISESKSDHDRQDEQIVTEQPVHAFRLFAAPSTGDRSDVKSGHEGAGESLNGKVKTKTKTKSSKEPNQARAQDGKDARPSANTAVSHIVLDPSVADDAAAAASGLPGGFSSGGFLRARSMSHYRATAWTAAQKSECAKIAVTPEQLAVEAKTRHPGLIVPWRVSTIGMSKRSIRILQGWETGGEAGALKSGKPEVERKAVEGHLLGPSGHLVRPDRTGKPRPGKKTRLMLRKKIREAAERKIKEAEAEEERRREKTKKNREKKVRRKMKAKEKEEEGKEKEGEESVDVSMTAAQLGT